LYTTDLQINADVKNDVEKLAEKGEKKPSKKRSKPGAIRSVHEKLKIII